MGYQLSTDGTCVIRLSDSAYIPCDPANTDYQTYLNWVAAGNIPTPAQGMTVSSLAQQLEEGVQLWLDQVAQGNGYADANSCVSYYNSNNATYAADAKSMVAWRDAVWAMCYAMEQSMEVNVPNPPPTVAQIVAQLPQPASYGWTTHAPGS